MQATSAMTSSASPAPAGAHITSGIPVLDSVGVEVGIGEETTDGSNETDNRVDIIVADVNETDDRVDIIVEDVTERELDNDEEGCVTTFEVVECADDGVGITTPSSLLEKKSNMPSLADKYMEDEVMDSVSTGDNTGVLVAAAAGILLESVVLCEGNMYMLSKEDMP